MPNFLRADVTAIKCVDNQIFAGIGGSVNIFDKESDKLLEKVHVLQGQNIYGVVASTPSIFLFVHGGKQFAFMKFILRSGVSKWEPSQKFFCDDWIQSADWVNSTHVGVLTSHNVVQIWNAESLTMMQKIENNYNSILYSGLLLPLVDDILVFSGTVYSEVIVQTVQGAALHYLRGHKGAIFSISCNPEQGLIVTTSDDRSVRIWGIHKKTNANYNTSLFWQQIKISCLHELYGHASRVMRSIISSDCVISVGEDSGICFWSFCGIMLKKITAHQNGCVWCIDVDHEYLFTGGSDGAIIAHPLSMKEEYGESKLIDINVGPPKYVEFTGRRNLVIVTENNELIYYNIDAEEYKIYKLFHKTSFKLFGISSCKQMVAVCDTDGRLDIFTESYKDIPQLLSVTCTNLIYGRIRSMHWASNRHLIFCANNGVISIAVPQESGIRTLANFSLPQCKERWLTAVALTDDGGTLIVADRCGHIHLYMKKCRYPVKSFDQVHGRYGATSINIRGNEITTTGRDGSIKYFYMPICDELKYMSRKDVELQWIEKFLDRNNRIICGFQEKTFIIFDLITNTKLIEVDCGGGHRPWDSIRYIDTDNEGGEEIFKFVYIKNSKIFLHIYPLNRVVSRNVIYGTHPREINCLRTLKSQLDDSLTFIISGGEDTTLRISKLDDDLNFCDEIIFKQLSSVKTLKTVKLDSRRFLLMSAGGRAQICLKILTFENSDTLRIVSEEVFYYHVKSSERDRRVGQSTSQPNGEAETRIMDLEIMRTLDGYKIYAGCSDGYLRTFVMSNDLILKPVKSIQHHDTCILKIHLMKLTDKAFIVTCTSRGAMAFWEVNSSDLTPSFLIQTNKSGINCISSQFLYQNRALIATGGDDNSLHVLIVEVENWNFFSVIDTYNSDVFHCSQISGILCVDDLIISTSLDQRVTVVQWSVIDCRINCRFINQCYTDIADIQGMDVVVYDRVSVTLCVYGKGMEVVEIDVDRK